ncbi:1856_t:CDS:2, partial [Diversispora eburnea]
MSQKQFETLKEKDIQPGDYVSTRFRGGSRQGYVEEIVKNEEQAKEHPEVIRPPKVVFTDQHGHKVAHNPTTLTNHEEKSERDKFQTEET